MFCIEWKAETWSSVLIKKKSICCTCCAQPGFYLSCNQTINPTRRAAPSSPPSLLTRRHSVTEVRPPDRQVWPRENSRWNAVSFLHITVFVLNELRRWSEASINTALNVPKTNHQKQVKTNMFGIETLFIIITFNCAPVFLWGLSS